MRLTIGKKLNGLLISLQILSIGGVVILATQLFTADLTGLLRKGTLDVSTMLAGRVRAEMKHVADRARMLGAASLESFTEDADRQRFIQDNLAVDATYIALAIYRKNEEGVIPGATGGSGAAEAKKDDAAAKTDETGAKDESASANWVPPFVSLWRIFHPEVLKKLKPEPADFLKIDRRYTLNFEDVSKGKVDFTIGKLKDGTPILRMGLPFVQRQDGTFSQMMAIELHQERLTSLFGEIAAYTSYLIDQRGRVLGSTDPTRIPLADDMSQVPIVASLKDNKGTSGQMDYKDKTNEMQMGAFQRVGFADLTIITQVPMDRALIAQKQLYRRTAFLAGAFLFLALCLGFLTSQGITGPIQALAAAAASVARGDFSVRLKTKAGKGPGDEIQQFSATFNEMVTGLEERDRVKATFAKFHNKEIAEKLMSGEVKLGGERKHALVFFSDVRGFTAMSEGMDPEALVKVLNRYMTAMVKVIMGHNGNVDKYVGDAIMALWGIPLPKEGDALICIKACLEMRKALAVLNDELIAEGLPPLKIGMGVNYGPLVAGNIGSEERMEYTVIGDTVNTASRIESLTKEFGTDLLISQEVVNQVQGKFVLEKAHEAKVKGKTEPLVIYKVLGYIEDGKEIIVETPYSSYKAEKSDKVVHDDKHKAPPSGDEEAHVAPAVAAPAPVAAVAPAAVVIAPVAAPAVAPVAAVVSTPAIDAEPTAPAAPVSLQAESDGFATPETAPVAAEIAPVAAETAPVAAEIAPVAAEIAPVAAESAAASYTDEHPDYGSTHAADHDTGETFAPWHAPATESAAVIHAEAEHFESVGPTDHRETGSISIPSTLLRIALPAPDAVAQRTVWAPEAQEAIAPPPFRHHEAMRQAMAAVKPTGNVIPFGATSDPSSKPIPVPPPFRHGKKTAAGGASEPVKLWQRLRELREARRAAKKKDKKDAA